jgi:hypothetical protein
LQIPEIPGESPWPLTTLVTGTGSDKGLAVGNIDGDRHPDLCAGYQMENKQYQIDWWKNLSKQLRRPDRQWKREVVGEAL